MTKPVTKDQIKIIHTLLNANGLLEEKPDIIYHLTEGRTSSTKELSLIEAKHFIEWLTKLDPVANKNRKEFTEPRKMQDWLDKKSIANMKKKVFALAYEIGMIWGNSVEDSKMNVIKINQFLLSKGTVKKELNDLNRSEAIKVVNQFQKMKDHNEYTQAGKETKQLLRELKIQTK